MEGAQASKTQRRQRRKRVEDALAAATLRRDRVEDRYADGDLDREAFQRMSARYGAEVARLRGELNEIGRPAADAESERVQKAVELMTDLRGIWERAGEDQGPEGAPRGTDAQAALAGSIYPDGAVFDGAAFRTAVPSPVLWLLGGKRADNETAGPLVEAGRPVGYAREDSNL